MFKNKSLTVGLVALVAVAAVFLLKGNTESTSLTNAAPVVAAAEMNAAPAVDETVASEGAAAETAVADVAPAAGEEAPAAEAAKEEPKKAEEAAASDLLAAPAAAKLDVAEAMKEQVLGNENAPVTIYEYASLTCPHCAYFHTTILPQVKKELIETGKAKIIFRDFPLDNYAVKAAQLAHCVSPLKYYNMLEVLFSNQERWVKASDPLHSLQQLGELAGIDAATFKACTSNAELETAILARMKDGQSKYKIEATPTFVFNDGAEKIAGAQSIEKFVEIVNKLTAGK